MASSPLFSQVYQNKITLSPLLSVNTIYLIFRLHISTTFTWNVLHCAPGPGIEINAAQIIAVSECFPPPKQSVCVCVYIYTLCIK